MQRDKKTDARKINRNPASFSGGQAIMTSVIFLLFISLGIVLSIVSPLVRETRSARSVHASKQSYYITESGIEDAVMRIMLGKEISSVEILELNGYFATTTITTIGSDSKEIISIGDVKQGIRKVETDLTITTGNLIQFNFGIQSGNGGVNMDNNAVINGNVYSNGTVTGSNDNIVTGSIVSASSSGLIDNINVGGDAFARTISNSTVSGDAYYENISNTIVSGTLYPASPDLPRVDLPIPDSMIEDWKMLATSTIISSPCPYIINSTVTIGPAKIECDLNIKSSAKVTLTGIVWVEGNLEIENNAVVSLDPALGAESSGIIVDNYSDRETGSKILLKNNTIFNDSGTDGSYVFLISNNTSAENGGGEAAITMENNSLGDVLLYSNHGEISIENNGDLRQVTGYKISLKNNAVITYETGLASTIFYTGPGGNWQISNWEEI